MNEGGQIFDTKQKIKEAELKQLIDTLRSHGRENEWLEFKVNHNQPQLIGEYLSALSNSACLHDQPYGYLVFGIDDQTHKVIGTDFCLHIAKGKGNEGLEPWLARLLAPRVDFRILESEDEGRSSDSRWHDNILI